ncbi:prolyl oligopeptidase family serine peptidase [Streptomyces sp. SL13]|uniref:Prolyl oligopeptidase family serine peptidase n=1 Tax=Streptantibioticus silvisoli TaxID=2705255 RepID=A0AA90H3S3_9ACTN|nr:prolyl oligopeptidase family serine peptidase [Streptantibioticus silvisoli]MDI5970463.1 prolyl oligopeptidase family serine peptidase [Streptantibioticus silvisoli]
MDATNTTGAGHGDVSFPRQHARTQRFTLGAPRTFTVSPDGERVVFLRGTSGTDRANRLWVLETATGAERVAGDPGELLGGAGEALTPEERARRERSREGSAGVVGYAVDGAVRWAVFALSGRLFLADLRPGGGAAREIAVPGPVAEPRLSPDGRWIAYTAARGLRLVAVDDGDGDRPRTSHPTDSPGTQPQTSRPTDSPGTPPQTDTPPRTSTATTPEAPGTQPQTSRPTDTPGTPTTPPRTDSPSSPDRLLAGPGSGDGPQVCWGLAEFVAAEEMDRVRGFWWSPRSDAVLAARVDDAPVRRWWIADPANPQTRPAEVAYPAAGTPNAEVTLAVLGLDGTRTDVTWDRERYPYLARAHWSAAGPPLLLVQARDQRTQAYLTVDVATGRTDEVLTESDPAWLELFAGVPAWLPDGRLLRIADVAGVRVLLAGDEPLTGGALHPRAVLDVGDGDVLLTASAGADAAEPETGEIHVYRAGGDAAVRLSREPGVHGAVRGGPTTVLVSAVPSRPGSEARVLRDGRTGGGTVITSFAERPVLTARPVLTRAGDRRIPAAVFLPSGYREADGRLPVLVDPYGGPHGQRVTASHNGHLTSQWFADQGFAVVVADGRGTPGHSPGWEKAVAGDFAGVTLEDQVAALRALAGEHPLDLDRVGVRGWSYGGYLAALAVLRRPDVFHAGIAGAPVTDWRLYDTHYTERYLGHPDRVPEVYDANSLVAGGELSRARGTRRPLMVVHGLADDNVVAAHTLRLSSALLAAGHPHEVLPLSGVTHMTPQEVVAENLLLLQVDFLRRSLGVK